MLEVMAEEKVRGCIQSTIKVAAVGSPRNESEHKEWWFVNAEARASVEGSSRVAENAQMS